MGPTVETHKYINRQTTTEAVGACGRPPEKKKWHNENHSLKRKGFIPYPITGKNIASLTNTYYIRLISLGNREALERTAAEIFNYK